MIKAYCDACGGMKNAYFDEISKDDLNEFPWGDLVCECSMVIATLGAEKIGKIVFVPHSGGGFKMKPCESCGGSGFKVGWVFGTSDQEQYDCWECDGTGIEPVEEVKKDG